MSNEQPPKSRLALVPSILAGSAALIAAASTLYVNLRHDAGPAPAPVVAASVPAAPATDPTPAVAAPTAPQVMLLRLDRVQVDNDGSVGSTDWTFQVNAGDKPLFAVSMPSLNDKPGENLASPADKDAVSAEVELPRGKNLEISVNGWKKGWLPGASAEVSGKAWMAAGRGATVITLASDKPKGPRFVLYFSATPTD